MKKFGLVAAITVVVAIAVGIFFACQKDLFTDGGGIKSHKSSEFYDQALLRKFMDERLVQEFKEYVNSLEIKKKNGILL